MRELFNKLICIFILISFFSVSGCGAIFYPERKGNTTNIDPKVAVLDGIGLVFFIIPGVVAYAIDFATGCIYLSGGGKAHTYSYYDPKLNDISNPQYQFNQIVLAQYQSSNAEIAFLSGSVNEE